VVGFCYQPGSENGLSALSWKNVELTPVIHRKARPERLFSATGKTKRCLSYFSRCVGSRVYLTTCVFGSIECMDSGSRHHTPGQIITTSAEVTPKCGFVRESPQNTLKNYSNLLKIHHLIESCKPARNPWIQELFSMAHRRLDLVNAFCQHLCRKHSFYTFDSQVFLEPSCSTFYSRISGTQVAVSTLALLKTRRFSQASWNFSLQLSEWGNNEKNWCLWFCSLHPKVDM